MFDVTNHEGNANQNHEIPPHTPRTATTIKTTTNVGEDVEKLDPCAVTVETGLVVLQTVKTQSCYMVRQFHS